MKLLYLANVRLPTEKAHGLQIMEMCAAFAKHGAEIELVVPRRRNHLSSDPFAYYGVSPAFRISRTFAFDLAHAGRIGYVLSTWSFAIFSLFRHLRSEGIAYTRDAEVAALLSLCKRKYVFEPHIGKWNPIVKMACQGALLILPITRRLLDFFKEKGIPDEKMSVAPDGVNLERFDVSLSREECRRELGLPLKKRIILYAGHLYARKGPHVLAEAAPSFPEDTIAVFVGGNPGDVEDFRGRYAGDPKIMILGHRPHDEIPKYLRAADVLVLPNSAKSDDSRLYTSPMKLFEYMASGTPIVASDVPSLREVLDETSAYWCEPDDPGALSDAIDLIFSKRDGAQGRAKAAYALVSTRTWTKRAESVAFELDSRLENSELER